MVNGVIIKYDSRLVFFLTVITGAVMGIITNYALTLEARGFTYLLVGTLGLLIFIPIIYRFTNRTFEFAELGMWFSLYYFAIFGIRAVGNIMFEFPSHHFWNLSVEDANRLQNIALLISLLGYLSFRLVYNRRRLGHRIANSIPKFSMQWNPNLIIPVSLLCLIIGWSARYFLLTIQGGSLQDWLMLWMEGNLDDILRGELGVEYYRQIGNLATFGLYILYIGGKVFHRVNFLILFWCLFIPEILLMPLISGSRAKVVFYLLSILIINYMTSERGYIRSVKLVKWGFITFLIFLITFPIITAFRFKGLAVFQEGISFSDFFLSMGIIWRFEALDALAIIINKVPEEVPYRYLSDFWYLIIGWIPRAIFPDKPVSLSLIFGETFVPYYHDMQIIGTVSLVGQFYWAFGIVGVVLGMAGIGLFYRVLNEYLVSPKQNMSNVLIVASMFNFFVVAPETDLTLWMTLQLFNFIQLLGLTLLLKGKFL